LNLALRRFVRLLLIAAALSGEAAGWFALSAGVAWIAFGLHAVASLFAGAIAAGAGSAQRDDWSRFVVAGLLAVSLPGVGLCGVLLVVVPLWLAPPFAAAEARDTPVPDRPIAADEAAEVASLVLASSLSPEQRVRALLALRGMSARAAVPAFQAALRGGNEEVRLLAHALLERCEVQRRRAIEGLRAELETASAAHDDARRWSALRGLAHAHWALADDGLAQRESAVEALAQASRFAAEALALRGDGELCLLLVRIELRRDDGLRAWQHLQLAERAGVSREARAPLYAEAAFLLRRFEQVPHWLRRAGLRQFWRPENARLVSFWLHEGRNPLRGGPSSS
jgi:tetratricopeptide (TPR) repeat protein